MFKGLKPSLQSFPKNVIYTESWHLDKLQSPHMGTGVSSSHQAKNQPLFPVSRLALVGDGFLTITSIHEAKALGSILNNSSLSYREQGNSCRVFPVMLLIFKCCSLRRWESKNSTPRGPWPIFMITAVIMNKLLKKQGGGGAHRSKFQVTTKRRLVLAKDVAYKTCRYHCG